MTESLRSTPSLGPAGTNSDGAGDQRAWLIRYGAPCPFENLEVRRLSDHEWRVGDNRCLERSPEKVLGYIEQSGSSFDVLNVRAPDRHVICDRFETAVASFAATSLT